MMSGDRAAWQFFENQAPKTTKILRKNFGIQVSPPRSMTPFDFEEILENQYGDSDLGPRGLDRYFDIEKFYKSLGNLRFDLEKKKMTIFHLFKLAVHLGLMDLNKFCLFIDDYKMPFWDGIYLAYEAKGLTAFKPPFKILKPQKRDDLEDLLNQEPELKLNNRESLYSSEIIESYGLNRPYIKKGKSREKLLNILTNYPGTYLDNRIAWDLYDWIMGDQGALDKITNPGFVHFLVLFTEREDRKEKYRLASDFLKLYLGIEEITFKSIKNHIQNRTQ